MDPRPRNFFIAILLALALLLTPAIGRAATPFDHELVTASGLTGLSSSLALDPQGNPHIAFAEFPAGGSPALRYASKAGDSWTVETIATTGPAGYGQVSLAFDPLGNPWISYYDAGFRNLLYANKTNETWQTNYLIDYGADVGSYNSLAIDRRGVPHVAYYDATNGDLKYASYVNGWAVEVVHSAGNVGLYCSLTFDTENSPHISYQDASSGWLRYAYKGGGGWIFDVADGNPNVGRFTSIALDTQNRPHIAYYDDFNAIVKYASKTTAWSTENVAISPARPMSLKIDAQDVPHIAYSTSALRHAAKISGVWNIDLVDAVNVNSMYASLALDAEGNPLLCYEDLSNADLIFATSAVRVLSPTGGEHWQAGSQQPVRWSGQGPVDILLSQDGGASYVTSRSGVTGGSALVNVPAWTTASARVKIVRNAPRSSSESPGVFGVAQDILPLFWTQLVDGQGWSSTYTSLALDAQGNPSISYDEESNPSRQKFAKHTAAGWSLEIADTLANSGGSSSLRLDALGNPRIAYGSFGDQKLRYASKSGVWTREVVDNNGLSPSLALTATGDPRISYHGLSGLQYASKSGGPWSTETVDASLVDGFTSLALDTAGTPYISYYLGYYGGSDLRFATKTMSGWTIEAVDQDGDVGGSSSIALDARGTPHIAYSDWTNGDLKYATRTPFGWVLERVDALGFVGNRPSLAFDAQGIPHIAYEALNGAELRYASKVNGVWVIEKIDGAPTAWLIGPSLALDAQGLPHLCYGDGVARTLRYGSEAVEIAAPTPGVTWPVGTHRTVTWNGTGRVNLSLSVDGGVSYAPIASGVLGGSYQITVPHTPSKFCKIKLERAVPQAYAATDSFFTIQTSVQLLALLAAPAPNRGPGAVVTWNTDPGPADLAGYRLDRASVGSDWKTVAPLIQGTSYEDPTAGPATRYRLFAVDGLGEELMLGETELRPMALLTAWPLPYRGGNLSISFATGAGWGGGAATARVNIYDASGRLVRTVAEGSYPAGYNAVIWDGTDGRGARVATGIYFLRSENAGERRTMKLAVLR